MLNEPKKCLNSTFVNIRLCSEGYSTKWLYDWVYNVYQYCQYDNISYDEYARTVNHIAIIEPAVFIRLSLNTKQQGNSSMIYD